MNLSELLVPGILAILASIITSLLAPIVKDRLGQRKEDAETRKTDAEATRIDVETELALAAFWRECAEKLERKFDELRADHDKLRNDFDAYKDATDKEMRTLERYVRVLWKGVNKLMAQLVEAGIDARWTPNKEIEAYIERLNEDGA